MAARGTVELSKVKLSTVLTLMVKAGSPETTGERPECDAATSRYLFNKSISLTKTRKYIIGLAKYEDVKFREGNGLNFRATQ